MEEVITIKKSELQELVAEIIAKKAVRTRKDFGDVSITNEDIANVNRNHPAILEKLLTPYADEYSEEVYPFSKHSLRFSNVYNHNVFLTKRLENKNGVYLHSKSSLFTSDIHNSIKSLTLALHGATVIKDLTDYEFEKALNTYNEIKNFFLNRYNVRLTKLEQDVLFDKNEVENE